jgi:hypothetical protein
MTHRKSERNRNPESRAKERAGKGLLTSIGKPLELRDLVAISIAWYVEGRLRHQEIGHGG